jgi:hypothetical protein
MIEVVNMRNCRDFGTKEGDVRIDRATKWGNPYKLSKTRSRDQSIRLYEDYFVKKLLKDIEELRGARRLGCWCKPLNCHGTVILDAIEREFGGVRIDRFTLMQNDQTCS